MTSTKIAETTASTGETTRVFHNADLKRYEIWLDDAKVGHADYSVRPGEIHFVHTEVDPAQQGKNLAAILMRESIAAAQRSCRCVLMLCATWSATQKLTTCC
jgi:predicted GNAT family acetyltransferase